MLKPLWAAYAALAAARDRREPLDLDLPERKIMLDERRAGRRIVMPRAARRASADRGIHDPGQRRRGRDAGGRSARRWSTASTTRPRKEKLEALREFLQTLDIKLPPQGHAEAGAVQPASCARPRACRVPSWSTRWCCASQARPIYDPENIGHFGLNLRRYAHFTSPIRRYADLDRASRADPRARASATAGLTDEEARLAEVASRSRKPSAAPWRPSANRRPADRGASRRPRRRDVPGRIAGVTRSGLFVRLKDTGADGFVPVSSLRRRLLDHVEAAHALVGERTGEAFRLGDTVEVRLVEAIPSAGALRFEMLTPGKKGELGRLKGLMSRRPKPRRYGPPRRRLGPVVPPASGPRSES